MERLTETNNCIGFMETYLNVNCKECQHKGTVECEKFKDECKEVTDFKSCVKNMYSKLKEYEDLEEQGKLLRLPAAVGDTVYEISRKLLPLCIKNFEISADRIYANTVSDVCGYSFLRMTLDIDNLGKTWFLTREQAEAVLKEIEREE